MPEGYQEKIHVMVVEGIPSGRIVEVAGQKRPAAIVMGNSGHRGMQQLWYGSVSTAVKKQACCELVLLDDRIDHPVIGPASPEPPGLAR